MIDGNDADNDLKGGDGKDALFGGLGGDVLAGDDGIDVLRGDDGDDDLSGGGGADRLFGGMGFDQAVYITASGVTVSIASLSVQSEGRWVVTGFNEADGDRLTGIDGFVFGAGADKITLLDSPDPITVKLNGAGGVEALRGESAISSRRMGVRRAFLWMFIRGAPDGLKCANSSLPDPPRMDNLMKDHS